ncbi:DUF58 domain-containing protein [Candidatus Saganbacteria bacterium]|nr:DUF58 domain-containing protein [Candidatus Saganbacteria bacterium]
MIGIDRQRQPLPFSPGAAGQPPSIHRSHSPGQRLAEIPLSDSLRQRLLSVLDQLSNPAHPKTANLARLAKNLLDKKTAAIDLLMLKIIMLSTTTDEETRIHILAHLARSGDTETLLANLNNAQTFPFSSLVSLRLFDFLEDSEAIPLLEKFYQDGLRLITLAGIPALLAERLPSCRAKVLADYQTMFNSAASGEKTVLQTFIDRINKNLDKLKNLSAANLFEDFYRPAYEQINALVKLGEAVQPEEIVSQFSQGVAWWDVRIGLCLAATGKLEEVAELLLAAHDRKAITDKDFVQNLLEAITLSPFAKSASTSGDIISQRAALVRSLCAREYRQPETLPGQGSGSNGGKRIGRRGTGHALFDLRELTIAPRAAVDIRQIDWNATARLDPAQQASGLVVVKKFNSQDANKVMIVVDPRIYKTTDREKIAVLVGAIAEMALKDGDIVGLIIGHQKAYLPPTKDRFQLENVIRQTLAETEATNENLTNLLEQPRLSGNVPAGAKVIVVADFVGEANILAAAAKHFRSRRVDFVPVTVNQGTVMPKPVVKIGNYHYEVHPTTAQAIADYLARQRGDVSLEKLGGTVIGLDALPDEPSVVRATIDCVGLGKKGRSVEGKGRVDASHEQIFDLTTPMPAEVKKRWVDLVINDSSRSELGIPLIILDLWSKYLRKGYGEIIDTIVQTIDGMISAVDFASERTKESLRKARSDLVSPPQEKMMALAGNVPWIKIHDFSALALPQDMNAQSLLQLGGWGPDAICMSKTLLECQQAQAAANSKNLDNGNPLPINPLEEISLSASGVDKDPSPLDQLPWLALSPAPKGRNCYLLKNFGDTFDPRRQTFKPTINVELLAEKGDSQIAADLLDGSMARGLDHLQPVGGQPFARAGNRIMTTVNTDPPPPTARRILSLPQTEFIEQAQALFGQAMYRQMVDVCSLEEIRQISPEVANEWQEILAQIKRENLTVGQAINLIQFYFLNSRRFTYHHYQDKVARTSFQALSERAARGECRGQEFLAFALAQGGGTCVQMAHLAMTLLRLAGIPTIIAFGWVVEADGIVKREGHAWPQILLGDSLYWYPVEVSSAYAPANPTTPFRDWLETASPEQKVVAHRAIETLYLMAEVDQNKRLEGRKVYNLTLKTMGAFLGERFGGPLPDAMSFAVQAMLDYLKDYAASHPTHLQAWYRQWRRADPTIPRLKELFGGALFTDKDLLLQLKPNF